MARSVAGPTAVHPGVHSWLGRALRPRRLVLWLAVVLFLTVLHGAGQELVVRKPVDDPDAIVMLASHEWERIPETVVQARRFPRSTIVLTLPRTMTQFNCYRCPERMEWLRQEGIDPRRIVLLPWTTTNTYDEAQAVLRWSEHRPFKRVLVVTSPYHTRRALRTFETVLRVRGVQVGVEPASATSEAVPSRWWLHRYDRHYVVYEWAANVFYRGKFGVRLFRAP